MYLDARADHEQRAALEAIFTGRLGGDALRHFPWAWKEADCVAVKSAAIEVSHAPRRQWLGIRDHLTGADPRRVGRPRGRDLRLQLAVRLCRLTTPRARRLREPRKARRALSRSSYADR
jgi:hypothetical protein